MPFFESQVKMKSCPATISNCDAKSLKSAALTGRLFASASSDGFALGIGRIGPILGPVVGGLLLATQMPLQTLFTIGALPALVAAIAIWGLTRKDQPGGPVRSELAH